MELFLWLKLVILQWQWYIFMWDTLIVIALKLSPVKYWKESKFTCLVMLLYVKKLHISKWKINLIYRIYKVLQWVLNIEKHWLRTVLLNTLVACFEQNLWLSIVNVYDWMWSLVALQAGMPECVFKSWFWAGSGKTSFF